MFISEAAIATAAALPSAAMIMSSEEKKKVPHYVLPRNQIPPVFPFANQENADTITRPPRHGADQARPPKIELPSHHHSPMIKTPSGIPASVEQYNNSSTSSPALRPKPIGESNGFSFSPLLAAAAAVAAAEEEEEDDTPRRRARHHNIATSTSAPPAEHMVLSSPSSVVSDVCSPTAAPAQSGSRGGHSPLYEESENASQGAPREDSSGREEDDEEDGGRLSRLSNSLLEQLAAAAAAVSPSQQSGAIEPRRERFPPPPLGKLDDPEQYGINLSIGGELVKSSDVQVWEFPDLAKLQELRDRLVQFMAENHLKQADICRFTGLGAPYLSFMVKDPTISNFSSKRRVEVYSVLKAFFQKIDNEEVTLDDIARLVLLSKASARAANSRKRSAANGGSAGAEVKPPPIRRRRRARPHDSNGGAAAAAAAAVAATRLCLQDFVSATSNWPRASESGTPLPLGHDSLARPPVPATSEGADIASLLTSSLNELRCCWPPPQRPPPAPAALPMSDSSTQESLLLQSLLPLLSQCNAPQLQQIEELLQRVTTAAPTTDDVTARTALVNVLVQLLENTQSQQLPEVLKASSCPPPQQSTAVPQALHDNPPPQAPPPAVDNKLRPVQTISQVVARPVVLTPDRAPPEILNLLRPCMSAQLPKRTETEPVLGQERPPPPPAADNNVLPAPKTKTVRFGRGWWREVDIGMTDEPPPPLLSVGHAPGSPNLGHDAGADSVSSTRPCTDDEAEADWPDVPLPASGRACPIRIRWKDSRSVHIDTDVVWDMERPRSAIDGFVESYLRGLVIDCPTIRKDLIVKSIQEQVDARAAFDQMFDATVRYLCLRLQQTNARVLPGITRRILLDCSRNGIRVIEAIPWNLMNTVYDARVVLKSIIRDLNLPGDFLCTLFPVFLRAVAREQTKYIRECGDCLLKNIQDEIALQNELDLKLLTGGDAAKKRPIFEECSTNEVTKRQRCSDDAAVTLGRPTTQEPVVVVSNTATSCSASSHSLLHSASAADAPSSAITQSKTCITLTGTPLQSLSPPADKRPTATTSTIPKPDENVPTPPKVPRPATTTPSYFPQLNDLPPLWTPASPHEATSRPSAAAGGGVCSSFQEIFRTSAEGFLLRSTPFMDGKQGSNASTSHLSPVPVSLSEGDPSRF